MKRSGGELTDVGEDLGAAAGTGVLPRLLPLSDDGSLFFGDGGRNGLAGEDAYETGAGGLQCCRGWGGGLIV